MRLLLLVAVIALGADALLYNGSYTQSTWREASGYAGAVDREHPSEESSARLEELTAPCRRARASFHRKEPARLSTGRVELFAALGVENRPAKTTRPAAPVLGANG